MGRVIYLILFMLFFILVSTPIFAASSQPDATSSQLEKIQAADYKSCQFILSSDDWRILSAIALLISSVFVAAMYLYGSVIDSSFIARAKNELFQILFTGLLIVFFAFIVNLMCGSLISETFNMQGSAYTASYIYLDKLSSYIRTKAVVLAGAATSLSFLGSLDISGATPSAYSTASSLFAFMSEPVSYFSDQLFILFGSLMLAYVTTIAQINILAIIPYLSLKFLVPVGIVLRSLYPFRKFGGALLGLGIGLYIFVPIILLFNNLLVGPYFDSDSNSNKLSLQCDNDSDCYSHICNYSAELGVKVCQPMKNSGESCNRDLECKSQKCINAKCFECGVQGSNNPICCKGYIRDPVTQTCRLASANGGPCTSSDQCMSGICDKDKKQCIPKKLVGESCNSDEECVSHSCVGIAPNKKCKQTLLTEEDRKIVLSEYAVYVTNSPSNEKQMFEVLTSGTIPLTGTISEQEVSQLIRSEISLDPPSKSTGFFYEKIVAPIVLIFIAGVLLPLLNITLISYGVSDISSALGEEIEIASIWRLL